MLNRICKVNSDDDYLFRIPKIALYSCFIIIAVTYKFRLSARAGIKPFLFFIMGNPFNRSNSMPAEREFAFSLWRTDALKKGTLAIISGMPMITIP